MNSSTRQISVRVALSLNRRDRRARIPVGWRSTVVLYVRMAPRTCPFWVRNRYAYSGGVAGLSGSVILIECVARVRTSPWQLGSRQTSGWPQRALSAATRSDFAGAATTSVVFRSW